MNYTKPEVTLLGEAVNVIEQRTLKPAQAVFEGINKPKLNAAYDLDE